MPITVKQGQSLIDIALQHSGSIEGVFELALQKGISITDDVQIGDEFTDITVIDKETHKYYTDNKIEPASGVNNATKLGGIDYMGIEIDFTVSYG